MSTGQIYGLNVIGGHTPWYFLFFKVMEAWEIVNQNLSVHVPPGMIVVLQFF